MKNLLIFFIVSRKVYTSRNIYDMDERERETQANKNNNLLKVKSWLCWGSRVDKKEGKFEW